MALEKYLAEKGLELKDVPGNQQVSCPWHEDRRPSASVNLERGLFHCFTCGMGGDIYALIMKDRGISFAEAKRYAERYFDEGDGGVRENIVSGGWVPSGSRPVGRRGKG